MKVTGLTVVITTYNRKEQFKRTIESVLSQTYTDYVLYIVDDASSDGTREVAEEYAERFSQIHYIRLNVNRGLAHARNQGIKASVGDYIAFLDDDDWWKPECLKKRIDVLEEMPDTEVDRLGVVYCGSEIHLQATNQMTYNLPRIQGDIRTEIIKHGLSTIPSSGLFRRKALEQAGGFDESLISSIDHDIWMSLAKCGYHAYGLNEPLVVTYEVVRRKAMVTDTSNRIVGVEQYLQKWAAVFRQWFGDKEGNQYIRQYRRQVLTRLVATKLQDQCWRDAWKVYRHVISQGHFFLTELLFIGRLLIVYLLKKCCSRKIMDRLRAMKYSRTTQC